MIQIGMYILQILIKQHYLDSLPILEKSLPFNLSQVQWIDNLVIKQLKVKENCDKRQKALE